MQVLAHNMLSQFTNRQLNITSKEKGKAAEKLSSGYRINRSADDAAGLSISEKMRSQIRGLNQASRNIQDGMSLTQVADGALNETHSVLQRMRELSVQAANDTNTTADRQAIQEEIEALTKEVDRIANDTSFNEGIYPLKGMSNISGIGGNAGLPPYLQIRSFAVVNNTGKPVKWDDVVYNVGDTVKGSYVLYDSSKNPDATWFRIYNAYGLTGGAGGGGAGYPMSTNLNTIDENMVNLAASLTPPFGSVVSVVSWGADTDGAIYFNMKNGKKLWFAVSNDGNSDSLGIERSSFTDFYFKINKNTSNGEGLSNIWIQMGAKSEQGMFLELVDATAKGVGITDPALDVTNHVNAGNSISRLDAAIAKVSTYRSSFGAQQNRLEHGKAIADNTAENTQDAESKIRDTDMAKEMVDYAKHNILEQAGNSMLAQANQVTQGILNLLT